MSLPISFLLGLLVVVAHREAGTALPGEATVEDVLWLLGLLVVPWLLACFARNGAIKSLLTARAAIAPPRALLRLSAVATPVVMHALFVFGAYGDCIDRLAPNSYTSRILLALAPLYIAEVPRMVMATMAESLLEAGSQARASQVVARGLLPRWADLRPLIRLRFGWPLLALLPAVMLGGCMDLLQLHRPTYVFVLATSMGMTIATIAFLVVAGMVLPFWFRFAFGVRAALPEPVGSILRACAQSLGFSPSRVFLLPTGMRSMNAMMVGPLPVGRLLCLTDGLLATLDSRSLTGVLAHEIGHARMGHPGMLMLLAVVVPLMLLAPLSLANLDDVSVVLQSALMLSVMVIVWLAVRTLARRFEFEADVSSVRALGAEPCSRALRMVSRMAGPAPRSLRTRLLSLHPDEQQRLLVMQRYEVEPEFRTIFDRQTRRLRRTIAAVVMVALAAGSWFWSVEWQYERALVRFHSGDYVGAQEALALISERPDRWRDALTRVDEELAAGLELAPGARDWATVQDRLVPSAWQRGERVLLAEGPLAARRWFSLAVSVMREPTATEYAIYEFCQAAAESNEDLMVRLARIIKRRGAPPRLAKVFRGYP